MEAAKHVSEVPSSSSRTSVPSLASLELPETALLSAVRAGVNSARTVTSFHPVTARGFIQWSETVASLRNSLDEQGWRCSNPKNSPRITSPDGRTVIMVIGGNADTGVSPDVSPATARRRGPATEEAVRGNLRPGRYRQVIPGQGVLDIGLVLDLQREPEGPQTWVLLYHWSTSKPEVRAELSLPLSVEDGEIRNWEHRIILPAQGLEEFEITSRPATGPQDDVDFMISERP